MTEPEVSSVRAIPSVKCTQFDVRLGSCIYRLVIGWIELENYRFPAEMIHVRLEQAANHLKRSAIRNV